MATIGKHRGKCVIKWTEQGKRSRAVIPECGATGCTDDARQCQRARLALDEFQRSLDALERTPDPTIGEIMEGYAEWLNEKGKDGVRVKYAAKALSGIAALTSRGVTTQLVSTHTTKRLVAGKSPSTVWTELASLRSALAWAKRNNWIDHVPHFDMPQKSPPRDRWLTQDEAKALIDAATSHHIKLFIIIALTTAARSSAILELTWDRVDMKRRRIDFNVTGKVTPGNKSRAVVPINDRLFEALKEARRIGVSEWVIEHHGKSVGSVKKGFAAAVKRAELIGVSPHTLRHSAATHMVMARVPMIEVSRYLGHTTTATTERVYAHHSPDYLKEASKALDW